MMDQLEEMEVERMSPDLQDLVRGGGVIGSAQVSQKPKLVLALTRFPHSGPSSAVTASRLRLDPAK